MGERFAIDVTDMGLISKISFLSFSPHLLKSLKAGSGHSDSPPSSPPSRQTLTLRKPGHGNLVTSSLTPPPPATVLPTRVETLGLPVPPGWLPRWTQRRVLTLLLTPQAPNGEAEEESDRRCRGHVAEMTESSP